MGSCTEPNKQCRIAVLVNSFLSISLSLLSVSLSLSLSLSDFRACCFILQLLSNGLACVRVCVLAEPEERCGREEGVQVLNSVSLSLSRSPSEVWMDVEYFSSRQHRRRQRQQPVSLLWRLLFLPSSTDYFCTCSTGR